MDHKTYYVKSYAMHGHPTLPAPTVAFQIAEDQAKRFEDLSRLVLRHKLLSINAESDVTLHHIDPSTPLGDADFAPCNILQLTGTSVVITDKTFSITGRLVKEEVQIKTEPLLVDELVAHFLRDEELLPRDEVRLGKEGQLVTADGEEIIGTLESLSGVALVSSATRQMDGTLCVQHAGETDVWWDEQKTEQDDNGRTLYVTESGDIVPEYRVRLVKAG